MENKDTDKNKMQNSTKYRATGRRKEAAASVWLMPGSGKILVNKRQLDKFFLRETDRIIVNQPLVVTDLLGKYDIVARIKGGGYSGQAGALQLAISRALSLISPDIRKTLKHNKFLTRDPRMKERKKYGQKGARKKFQWTKR